MSKKRIISIHIFIWLFALFANIPFANINKSVPSEQIVANIIAFLYLMVVFYLFYLFLVPYFLNRRKVAGFFGFSFLIILVMPFFGYTLLFLSRAFFEGTFHNFYRNYSLKMHMSGYYPVMTAAVFGSFFRVIINWFTVMNQKSETEKQKLAVELDLLKSKLNPHFLFNTLNNIDSLIQKDQAKASEALIRLSDMMRYLTYETSTLFVELNRDVDYLKNLVELYRLRIKSPEDIQLITEGDLTVKISPALFIPLVENAFKFAVFGKYKPGIDIRLNSFDGIIEFVISNYFDNYSKNTGQNNSGSGLADLKKRLELIYPGSHHLVIEKNELIFKVKLTIDTNND
jgi:two-component system, LytTR family, sensor kinase